MIGTAVERTRYLAPLYRIALLVKYIAGEYALPETMDNHDKGAD